MPPALFFLLALLSITLPLAHPADTETNIHARADTETDIHTPTPVIRDVYLECLVDKTQRIPIPPDPDSSSAVTIPQITVRLYMMANPSPYTNYRTDIGIPYILNLHLVTPSLPPNAILLTPTLFELDPADTPIVIPAHRLGRMIDLERGTKGLTTFLIGTSDMTNAEILDPASGRGILLDATLAFTAAGSTGGSMELMRRIIERLRLQRDVLTSDVLTSHEARQLQSLYDANMGGYMNRAARYERLRYLVLQMRLPLLSWDIWDTHVKPYWILDPEHPWEVDGGVGNLMHMLLKFYMEDPNWDGKFFRGGLGASGSGASGSGASGSGASGSGASGGRRSGSRRGGTATSGTTSGTASETAASGTAASGTVASGTQGSGAGQGSGQTGGGGGRGGRRRGRKKPSG
ncbi:hypothetical protein MMC11_001705 [Xylographa trunciseda]|nr:hypothetical protein [Xylographa trunciseda]